MNALQVAADVAPLFLVAGFIAALLADFASPLCLCGCGNPPHRHNQPRSHR